MLIDNKIKDHKSLGERVKVYLQTMFKKLEHTSVIFDLTAIVLKKKGGGRPWCLSCLQAKYEPTVLQFSPRTKEI